LMEIARLRGGDGGRLRDVRLRALADAPYAFSSSLAREVDLRPEFWEGRVMESELGEDGAVFIATEDDHSVGMAGGFFIEKGSGVVMLWGMWVDPRARQGGLGQWLVEAVAGWARDAGADHVRLAVTDCDECRPAAALYRKLGFVDTGEREPLDWNPSLTTRVLSRAVRATA
jgi:GNAT superfamily N-acetyltransferase